VSALEIAGFLTGVLSVALMGRQHVWAWPTGLVNVALYAVVFRDARLYADMGLQIVYFALCAYGWYHWTTGAGPRAELPVRRAPPVALVGASLVALLGFLALGALLRRFTDASLPYLDSALGAFSLVAQWLQARKWIENWLLWIAVDIVYVGLYVFKGLYLTAALYVVFLGLAVLGWSAWRASLRAHAA
jgi:nicotinamide mononucleotide transporter